MGNIVFPEFGVIEIADIHKLTISKFFAKIIFKKERASRAEIFFIFFYSIFCGVFGIGWDFIAVFRATDTGFLELFGICNRRIF